jgi:hypothetical protein
MAQARVELTLEETMMVLDFWAHGMNILQTFPEEKIVAVQGLREAIEAISILPDSVGFGDEAIGTT